MNVEPIEELETISLNEEHADQITRIDMQASPSTQNGLILFLRENLDIFSWSHKDMPGINPNIMIHQLNDSLSFPPVR